MISTLGPSIRTVFRSRWRALWWSAGVLVTAYCLVPSPDEDDAKPTAQAQHHAKSPWDKDSAN
ncbi:hypothetical protein [uncultured Novosphingobium sp.]|uniref:hypothetical protein n=1 Tax=uncultured Novosphingobium sp. TaxID=292277 RepID=UPI0025862F06|nr:hypothetical protein [uncultured Novosphingobium sp.]